MGATPIELLGTRDEENFRLMGELSDPVTVRTSPLTVADFQRSVRVPHTKRLGKQRLESIQVLPALPGRLRMV